MKYVYKCTLFVLGVSASEHRYIKAFVGLLNFYNIVLIIMDLAHFY